jgi:membrane-associated phospholipid phosphatase
VGPGLPPRRAVGAAIAAVVGSYLAVKGGRAQWFDRRADWVRRPLGTTADVGMAAATDLGSVYGVVGTAAALALFRRRDVAFDVAGAGATAWILAQAAKPLVNRQRPYELVDLPGVDRLVAIPAGSSWPSGHSAVAAATGSVIAAHSRHKTTGTAVGTALAGFVGVSRVYVGVHHASDVVAGAGLGVVSATLWGLGKALVTSRLGRGSR